MAAQPTCYIRRATGPVRALTLGAYRTIDGWSHNRSMALPYLPNSGLLAWDIRDLKRKGYRIDVVDGEPVSYGRIDAHGAPGENDPIDE